MSLQSMEGLQLLDVRGQRSLLSYHAGSTSLKGTSDAAVIPAGVSHVATSSQLRVIIDW